MVSKPWSTLRPSSHSLAFVADAEHVLRRALERFPHRVEAKIELARLFLEAGNDEKALQVATQAPARASSQQ